MRQEPVLSRAGQWFLQSGIQEKSGGVARYYRSDLLRNHAVSTEITGYTVSALLYLHSATHDARYLERAVAAARFLSRYAWDGRFMPFEIEPSPEGLVSYFFDCGIITRGLLAVWRATREQEFLDAAVSVGKSMAADFASAEGDYHPIVVLPEKRGLPRDATRWSRSPGCYQLKSALAWWEIDEVTGGGQFRQLYDRVLVDALRGYAAFLPGHEDRVKVVDRLHAFLYFLEGLLPAASERRAAAALCDGIRRVAQHLGETAAEFERSDVYAQLLRIRIFADWAGIVPLDLAAARAEADTLAAFQASHSDPRLDGGFFFGRKSGSWLPYVNPVSTAFGLQALALWEQYQAGSPAHWRILI
ncbi:MAG: hypothetical protein C5B51_13490 [Terriglobia bacterium]|nr:MAG: hypothetical protein C5B51_13490 [Terriglobia bacterium]